MTLLFSRLAWKTQSMFRLKVVTSGGTFVTEAKVTIEILDDNDSALSIIII